MWNLPPSRSNLLYRFVDKVTDIGEYLTFYSQVPVCVPFANLSRGIAGKPPYAAAEISKDYWSERPNAGASLSSFMADKTHGIHYVGRCLRHILTIEI